MQTATDAFAGSGPEQDSPLRDVVQTAVAGLADYCVVDIASPAGALTRVAVGCSRDGEPALVRALSATPPGSEPRLGIDEVVAKGSSRLVPRLQPDWASGLAADVEQLELLEDYEPMAALVVAIPGATRSLGAITLLTHSSQGLSPRMIEPAEALARMAAAALESDRWKQAAAVAEQARQEFLAVVSHELRTPLTTIIGYADLLRSGMSGTLDEVQRDRVERISESAWGLVREMEQILELVRAQSPGQALRLDTIELAAFTSGLGQMVEPLVREKGLDFRLERPEVRVEVVTDPDKLRRALINLISNAVRYTRRGHVALESVADNGHIHFAVRDTGAGIPPEERQRIFEPFWRGRANGAEGGGMGLGLSLARQLVTQLEGEIRVDSEPGAGSTFVVELPRELRSPRSTPSLGI